MIKGASIWNTWNTSFQLFVFNFSRYSQFVAAASRITSTAFSILFLFLWKRYKRYTYIRYFLIYTPDRYIVYPYFNLGNIFISNIKKNTSKIIVDCICLIPWYRKCFHENSILNKIWLKEWNKILRFFP